jgi:hypothetical protein
MSLSRFIGGFNYGRGLFGVISVGTSVKDIVDDSRQGAQDHG